MVLPDISMYPQCKQMVTGGHLPVTLDEAVFIASLQLHIDVSPSLANLNTQNNHFLSDRM